jgi:hypothetical protein
MKIGFKRVKARISRAFQIKERTFSENKNAWLATQWDSNQSPHKFPANREFYREFRKIRADDGQRTSKKCLSRSYFSYDSLDKVAGKKFARTGNFFGVTLSRNGVASKMPTFPFILAQVEADMKALAVLLTEFVNSQCRVGPACGLGD